MTDGPRAIGVLLVGGSGTRLWPLSSADRPKQFLRLFGDRSLYQKTLGRMRACPLAAVAAVVNERHLRHIEEQSQELGFAAPALVVEPTARDSGPALAAAAAWISSTYGPQTVVVAAPSDHLITDEQDFARQVARAIELARSGWIVTFGIRPTFASSEYGYIARGAKIAGHAGGFAVTKFHEKPARKIAEAYVAHGGYDWNSGILVFLAGVFAEEAERHMPELWAAVRQAVDKGARRDSALRLDAEAFSAARRISIDHALMEKCERVAVIPVTFEWSDVGSWDAVYHALEKDEAGNVVRGDAVLSDSSGTLVIADAVKVAMTGLKDMAVVCSRDGVFVAPRAGAAAVKTLVGA